MCKFIKRLFAKKHIVKTKEEISCAKAIAEEKLLHLHDAFYVLSEDTVTLYEKIEDFFF